MLLSLSTGAWAQYFQFSQYNFASQRVNPGLVSASNYASLSLLYRNQATGGDVHINSSVVSATYPVLNKRTGHRWSGVGITLMDDRSGNIFSTEEASLSYALSISPARLQTLSLGFKTLYQQRSINLDGLFTGSQYIPDRGFDESMYHGEDMLALRSKFWTFSTGLYWQQTDRDERKLAYWGISIFDFNKPDDSFLGRNSELNSTLVASGGLRVYHEGYVSVFPEVLLTRSASNHVLNIGAISSYELKPFPNQVAGRVDLITKYVVGRSGIVGIQLHRENFSVGMSYDFPVVKRNVGNIGAFEIGIEWRRLVDPRLRSKAALAKKNAARNKIASKTKVTKPASKQDTEKSEQPITKVSTDSARVQKPKPTLTQVLEMKKDSVLVNAEAGTISHQPLVLEKVTLYFNFDFNSSDLDENSRQYLDDLVTALKQDTHIRIKLIGHTDNIGSAKFNQRLSLFRANTIRDYLAERGIDMERIETDGRGLLEPLNENRNEEERAKNRRVELTILYDE